MGEGSELHRGKLECHPEKEGALCSAALVGVAQPFVSTALSHDGALHRSYPKQLRPRETNKGAKRWCDREVGPFKKKKKWCL